ncbi:MAG: glycosyltransferase, partial [Candidatus Omnitrophica bacterium]|nr:glycosyltransferase [Candidatus Omnitrophota bacterium]
QKTAQLELENHIVFAGWQANIPDATQALDIAALPSHSEGLGRVLIEAMVLNKPCVGTRIGGIPDVIEEGVTGLLVPKSDPQALAEALDRLLSDPGLAQRMGEAGHKRVEQIFETSRVVRGLEKIYEQMLEEARS